MTTRTMAPFASARETIAGAALDAIADAAALAAAATPVVVAVPATGDTITAAVGTVAMYLNPAATIAAATLLLPSAPVTNQVFQLSFDKTVASLTLLDSAAATISGAATVGSAHASTVMRYIGGTWVKWS